MGEDVVKKFTYLALATFTLSFIACSSGSPASVPKVRELIIRQPAGPAPDRPIPGSVNSVWVEPMYDTVRVPAGIDPSGTYFRPSHRSVVEIRPGRVQRVEY